MTVGQEMFAAAIQPVSKGVQPRFQSFIAFQQLSIRLCRGWGRDYGVSTSGDKNSVEDIGFFPFKKTTTSKCVTNLVLKLVTFFLKLVKR